MIDEKSKKNNVRPGLIIICVVVVGIMLLYIAGSSSPEASMSEVPQTNQPKELQPNDAQVQWEKEQNDIANEKLKKIYEGIDNGTITCKNGVCSEQ